MLETNLLGAVAWLNQAARLFERMGGGQIVGISSIAGERGRVAGPVYNTSKAALNTYLEALRNRLTRHGVNVLTVRPGFVQTELLKNSPKTFWVISPEQAADDIWHAIRGTQAGGVHAGPLAAGGAGAAAHPVGHVPADELLGRPYAHYFQRPNLQLSG